MSSRRKMLAADEDIANQVVEIAKRRGSTVYSTVNEILGQAIRADGMGLNLNYVIENREKMEKAKGMGFTFTIEKLLYEVVGLAHDKAGEELGEIWLETGRWYGRYFADKGGDPIESFREAMELLSLGTLSPASGSSTPTGSPRCTGSSSGGSWRPSAGSTSRPRTARG